MSYTPRAGSLADRVINHLKKHGGEIRSADIIKLFKTSSNNIHALLQAPLGNGTLVKRKDDDGHVWYGLGSGSTAGLKAAVGRKAKTKATAPADAPADPLTTDDEPAADAPTDPLTMSRWSDGDLVITGHQTTDEGAVVLTRKQVEQLLLFVLPHYVLPGMVHLMNESFKQQLLGD